MNIKIIAIEANHLISMLKNQLKKISLDWKIIVPLTLLLIIGFIMIFSTTSLKGLSEYNDVYFFIKRHIIFVVVSIFLFFLGLAIPVQKYRDFSLLGYLLSVLLLLLTLIPTIGIKIGGAQRWLNFFGFQFQPVELMKFWWAVTVSLVMSKKLTSDGPIHQRFLPIFIIMLVPIFCLIFQPDLGNSILMLGVVFVLLWVSPMPIMILICSVSMAVVSIIISILTHPYQMVRVQAFLNPWNDPLGTNYHIIQSLTAIGSGGFFGFGIGESRLKYFYLPLNYSDFIFSVLCEEGGVFLAIIVVVAFLLFFLRGVQIALKYPKYSFEQFLVFALTFFLVFQAIINICVVTGLFPVTGIPLTFISYGGTSLLSSMFSLGVIYKLGQGK